MKQEKKLIMLKHYFLYVVWFSYTITFCLLFMMEQEKKLIILSYYFLYVLSDEARVKTHSVKTLFFVCCLWWRKKKNSFCYNIIFCKMSMMEEEKNLILWYNYFLYVVYDEAREKTHSVITLFFLCFVWWSKRKMSFCYNNSFVFFLLWRKRKNSIC